MEYKICPTCRAKNPVDEILCINCMADLSNVLIITDEEKSIFESQADYDRTCVEVRERLILKHEKFSIEVISGEVVGRHAKGGEYLKEYPTVSRKHVRFYKEFDSWYVEDLNSTNGTYVNHKKINSKTKIKNGDVISLSSSISFSIQIT